MPGARDVWDGTEDVALAPARSGRTGTSTSRGFGHGGAVSISWDFSDAFDAGQAPSAAACRLATAIESTGTFVVDVSEAGSDWLAGSRTRSLLQPIRNDLILMAASKLSSHGDLAVPAVLYAAVGSHGELQLLPLHRSDVPAASVELTSNDTDRISSIGTIVSVASSPGRIASVQTARRACDGGVSGSRYRSSHDTIAMPALLLAATEEGAAALLEARARGSSSMLPHAEVSFDLLRARKATGRI